MLSKRVATVMGLTKTASRCFAAPTEALKKNLVELGIDNDQIEIVHNPTVAELYEYAFMPEHVGSPDPNVYNNTITSTGALHCSSGLRMGRTPNEKRVQDDEISHDTIWWGDVNMKIPKEGY